MSGESAWFLGIIGSGKRPTRVERGNEWTLSAVSGRVTVADAAGMPRGSSTDTLYAFPEDPESGAMKVNGRSYRGQLLLWANMRGVTAVSVVDLESYLRAVVPLEIGQLDSASYEAVKAQAVAARSYTLSSYGRCPLLGFDLFDSVEDQVYGGLSAERPVCSQAVEETRGVVAIYGGAPIRAYYCSTCGGHTAGPDEVWARPAAPYLRGVRDETPRVNQSFCSASPWFHWTEEWTGSDFDRMVRKALPRVKGDWDARRSGPLIGVAVRGRSASQRVSCLRLEFQHGHVDLSGDEIRWAIRRPNGGEVLRSALLDRVECVRRKGRLQKVRIVGQGYGHGVGMCQFGAMGMARAGYSYEQIVHFYYRGADLRRFY